MKIGKRKHATTGEILAMYKEKIDNLKTLIDDPEIGRVTWCKMFYDNMEDLITMWEGDAETAYDNQTQLSRPITNSDNTTIQLTTSKYLIDAEHIDAMYRSMGISPPTSCNEEQRCGYCGELFDHGMHQDHIVPKSRGGSNHHSNLIWACAYCNFQKRDRTPDEADMPIRFPEAMVKEGENRFV